MAQSRKELGVSYVVIESIAGHLAHVVLSDGTPADWRLSSLPAGVKEGDIVLIDVQGGDVEMEVGHRTGERRRTQRQPDSGPEGDPDP
ncbi:DUF3006 domain-containing protein [Deinococcus humi]|uniref:Sarcosine oxidase gamma subunit n=1 Tax=Deinococcus humi TaxID=662880 RepID=A0A7W8JZN5_9DEIO|nr:DUF3006 domain-containing protein [Deinococcus humi]MBB5366185.1 sarcosine oxidase gamma subunit [Deinococcus humi]GGO40783.1 hypothetical protein GCM10008949_50650 [Deinococcus humi]